MPRFFIITFLLLSFALSCSPNKQSETTKENTVLIADTFYAGNSLFCFKDTSSEAFFSLLGANIDKPEFEALKSCNQKVKRGGDTLTITFNNGSTKNFINNNSIESDNFTEYHLVHTFPDINYYLIRVNLYEAFTYLMINANSGKETYMCGIPTLNPNKTKLVSGCFDLEAGFVFNGLQMFTISKDSLQQNWSRELTNWGANNLAWINNNNFVAEKIELDSGMNRKPSYITIRECK